VARVDVVEIAMFKLKEGVDRDAFLATVEPTAAWLKSRPGFVRRELLEDREGQWIDLVHWSTLDDALAAGEDLMAAPEARGLLDAIDPTTVRMLHPQVIARTT
jgi:hypothetical protein